MNANLNAVFWQPARLIQAQETEIYSQYTQRRYRIQTAFIGKPPPQGYPVLYILDGDAFFPAALSMAQSLLADPSGEAIASCLLVGIGYAGANIRHLAARAADYTPPLRDEAAEDMQEKFGQANAFGRFIDEELKPLLAQYFAVDKSKQILFGHSFGALFGTYSLFAAPKRFSDYWLVSPSLWWHERRIWDFMPSESIANAKIYIAVGGKERGQAGDSRRLQRDMHGGVERLAQYLRQKGCSTVLRIHEHCHHGDVPFYVLPECITQLK